MDFKLILENWRKNIQELTRNDIDRIAQRDGGSNTHPTPFIGHNYRTRREIEDGTIQLSGITDNGIMTWTIVPFDPARKAKYKQYELAIQFMNWLEIIQAPATTKDKTLTLLKNTHNESDDIKIHCTCPSFKYHYNYVADKQGVAINPQSDPGKGIANPGQKGVVCKHGRRIIQVFPAYYAEIYHKIKEIEDQIKGSEIEDQGEDEESDQF